MEITDAQSFVEGITTHTHLIVRPENLSLKSNILLLSMWYEVKSTVAMRGMDGRSECVNKLVRPWIQMKQGTALSRFQIIACTDNFLTIVCIALLKRFIKFVSPGKLASISGMPKKHHCRIA